MKSITIILIVTFSSFKGNFKYFNKTAVYLKEYDYTFTPQKEGCVDTLKEKLDDGRELKITLSDCKGQMHLECYKKGAKVEEGDYTNSLALLKKYVNRIDGITGRLKIKTVEFYQPLRAGVWLFYDKKGCVIRKEIYVNGVKK